MVVCCGCVWEDIWSEEMLILRASQGPWSLWCFRGFLMLITLAALVPPASSLTGSCPDSSAPRRASRYLWAQGILFALHGQHILFTNYSCFTEARWRLHPYKGFPCMCSECRKQVPTASSAPNILCVPSLQCKTTLISSMSLQEAASVTWKALLSHFTWEFVFSGLLSFRVSLIPQGKAGKNMAL